MKLKNILSLAAVVNCLVSAAVADEMKELKVVTEPSFAPFEFVDKNTSEIIGFDVDIINAIGEVENLKMNISSMGFDGQIPAILTRQVDVAISGFTITEARSKMVNFTEPYYDAGLGALVDKKLADSIRETSDLEGKALCSQIGTSGAMYVDNIKGAENKQFNTTAEAIMELKKGSCAAVISDKPVIEYYLAETSDDTLFILPETFTKEQYGIVTSKQNDELTQKISSGLKKIKENGTYDKIYNKWFGIKKAK